MLFLTLKKKNKKKLWNCVCARILRTLRGPSTPLLAAHSLQLLLLLTPVLLLQLLLTPVLWRSQPLESPLELEALPPPPEGCLLGLTPFRTTNRPPYDTPP